MADPKQSTDKDNGEPVAGTGLSTLTPREFEKGTARHDSAGGESGENAEQGNRNKRS
jgi:hypothetical protein